MTKLFNTLSNYKSHIRNAAVTVAVAVMTTVGSIAQNVVSGDDVGSLSNGNTVLVDESEQVLVEQDVATGLFTQIGPNRPYTSVDTDGDVIAAYDGTSGILYTFTPNGSGGYTEAVHTTLSANMHNVQLTNGNVYYQDGYDFINGTNLFQAGDPNIIFPGIRDYDTSVNGTNVSAVLSDAFDEIYTTGDIDNNSFVFFDIVTDVDQISRSGLIIHYEVNGDVSEADINTGSTNYLYTVSNIVDLEINGSNTDIADGSNFDMTTLPIELQTPLKLYTIDNSWDAERFDGEEGNIGFTFTTAQQISSDKIEIFAGISTNNLQVVYTYDDVEDTSSPVAYKNAFDPKKIRAKDGDRIYAQIVETGINGDISKYDIASITYENDNNIEPLAYPNPATSNITFEGLSDNIRIFNTISRQPVNAYEISDNQYDISQLPSGSYYAQDEFGESARFQVLNR